MFGSGAVPRCGKGNGGEEEGMCWILNLIHVERNAENCPCETSGFPLGSLVLRILSLEDSSD